MKVVPQAFLENPAIKKILVDGLCTVLSKQVDQPGEQQERYLSAHALTLIKSGILRIELPGGDWIQVPENHLVFLPKGLYMVTDLLPAKAPFEATVFFVDDQLLAEYENSGFRAFGAIKGESAADLNHSKTELPLLIPVENGLQKFVTNLLDLYDQDGDRHDAITRPKLLELLHLLGQGGFGIEFNSRVAALRQREKKSLVEFMQENYTKPLKIEDFAYLTGRSVSTFHRDFKGRFGTGPKQWLIGQRLDKAKILLSNSNMQVQEVAIAVGYENIPHFIKSFRRKFEISPGQFSMQQRSAAAF